MTSPDLADTGPPIRPQTEMLVKPPWAAYIWTAENGDIILELPCPVGKAPVIVSYRPSEGGLAKALALIQQNANIKKSPPPPGYYRHGEGKVAVKRPPSQPLPSLATQPKVLQDAIRRALGSIKR